MPIRQPICVILGHVDHGKTTLLDKIRGTAVAKREPGEMTQHIGASFFPLKTLEEICEPVLGKFRGEIKIPGLLVIDTPGHEAFINLRKRGGSVADIAVLVIDVNRGLEMQTYECIEILKTRKTPFLIAANKVDLISGWKPNPDKPFTESLQSQDKFIQKDLDGRLYTMIGSLSRLGLKADRFDRVVDFTKFIAIIPVSAKTGEGIPELLSVLIGLTQQYMQDRLIVTKGSAKGVVLEVKEEVGLGITVNAIIYDGVLRKGDTVVIGGKEKPIITKIRAILLPKPLDEIRDPRDRFTSVEKVSAAAGIKIAAPGLENVLAGASLYTASPSQTPEELTSMISEEIEKLRISTDKFGVVIKTDTLGSLEAMLNELENYSVPIRFADVGDVSRREVIEAATVKKEAPLQGVVLAFNVKVLPDAEEEAKTQGVRIFQNNIIYQLIEEYTNWTKSEQETRTQRDFESLVKPGKIKIIPGYVFRKSKPAVFGVEILSGRIKSKCSLMKEDGKIVGEIAQIQDKGQTILEAKAGMNVAVSMKEPIVGRHIREGDTLYVVIPEEHAKILQTTFQSKLTPDESKALDEITKKMREKSPGWGL
ncbi:MAG TPA: translation initiation factor IF-2 [archaeon]|nr:translation initiation factor IF-2 [archaeon]